MFRFRTSTGSSYCKAVDKILNVHLYTAIAGHAITISFRQPFKRPAQPAGRKPIAPSPPELIQRRGLPTGREQQTSALSHIGCHVRVALSGSVTPRGFRIHLAWGFECRLPASYFSTDGRARPYLLPPVANIILRFDAHPVRQQLQHLLLVPCASPTTGISALTVLDMYRRSMSMCNTVAFRTIFSEIIRRAVVKSYVIMKITSASRYGHIGLRRHTPAFPTTGDMQRQNAPSPINEETTGRLKVSIRDAKRHIGRPRLSPLPT